MFNNLIDELLHSFWKIRDSFFVEILFLSSEKSHRYLKTLRSSRFAKNKINYNPTRQGPI